MAQGCLTDDSPLEMEVAVVGGRTQGHGTHMSGQA